MELNEEQKMAVETTKNNVVVIANAGSGKTTVLTERVRKLLNDGVSAHNIVAITFTNAAADEMRDRLGDIADECFIGTIHSYANGILRTTGEDYNILSDEQMFAIYREIIEACCTMIDYKTFLNMYEACDEMVVHKKFKVSDFNDKQWAEFSLLIADQLPLTCKEIIQRDNIISFDEIIEKVLQLQQTERFCVEHMLVDEFQDVGNLEYDFIFKLKAENYFLVGDPNQSIYGFKGSNPQLMQRIMMDESFTTYYLRKNYRTARSIALTAQNVISPIADVHLDLTKTDNGMVIKGKKNSISGFMRNLKCDSAKWFVLARSNKDLNNLAIEVEKNNIPYIIIRRANMSFEELKKALSFDGLKLMTIHASKGLESENVLVYGDTSVWYRRAKLERKKEYEEELRIMYVAFTRAKNKLVVLE